MIAGVVVVLIVRAGGPKPSAGPVESFPPPTRGPRAAAPTFNVLGYVGEGRLSRPMGVAVSPNGHMYVADQGSGRVQAFLADGTFDRAFGEISSPTGIAVSPRDGDVYVADADRNMVDRFSADGTTKTPIGPFPDSSALLRDPTGLTFDGAGNLYITSGETNDVQVLSGDGQPLPRWPGGHWGQHDSEFLYPQGIAIDSNGNVYVADLLNKRVQRFTLPGGTYQDSIDIVSPDNGTPAAPTGVVVDAEGMIFVADRDDDLVQRLNPKGGPPLIFGRSYLRRPEGLARDCRGNIVVADFVGNRLVRFGEPGVAPPPCGAS